MPTQMEDIKNSLDNNPSPLFERFENTLQLRLQCVEFHSIMKTKKLPKTSVNFFSVLYFVF